MKKEQLKQIIKEELQAMLNEKEMVYKNDTCKNLHTDYKDAYADGIANPGRSYSGKFMASAVAKAKKEKCKWSASL